LTFPLFVVIIKIELQGEEGFLGIVKVGNNYQLVDLTVSEKREPRQHLNEDSWQEILRKYDGVCAACGRTPDEDGFQQDHKIPRLRGGSDDLDNWQPFCDACNNMVCKKNWRESRPNRIRLNHPRIRLSPIINYFYYIEAASNKFI
jgi:5-methylcytosine-specific restriction endonuclease McrA